MDPAFSKPFPPGFLPSHDSRSVADPPVLCPVVLARDRLTRAKPLFIKAAEKRASCLWNGPVVARGMTSAVRYAARAWIRREPHHQLFEHRTRREQVRIVRYADIMFAVS